MPEGPLYRKLYRTRKSIFVNLRSLNPPPMTRKERFQFVLDYFSKNNTDAETELLYNNPYQLLVAVILSAQCTDKRVNMTTPAIFERYPDQQSLPQASFEELLPHVRRVSYP